ncbi:MAG: porin family protein [Bacteroidetes bacterium]|nr:porin family protein [Bacteroidota bacterium]
MNNHLFEDYLKSRLADQTEPVDFGGWEALSVDLNQRAKRKIRYRRFYYGCAAVAAVVLLIILLFPPVPDPHHVRQPLHIAVVPSQINTHWQRTPPVQLIRERPRKTNVTGTAVAIGIDSVQTEIETPQTDLPDSLIRQTPSNRPLYNFTDLEAEPQPVKIRMAATEGWSIALASSSANAMGQTPFAAVIQSQPNTLRDMFYVRSDGEVSAKIGKEASVQFSPPISAGVNVQKELFSWMSVGIGLNYTLLQTKSSNPYLSGAYTIRQHLHYVGLPASVLFSFVHQPTLRVYASAGGCVEKAISAYYTSSAGKNERVQVSGLQWSVGAGLGVEYALSKRFGLYVEPGAGYYFDNDQPRSIRTVQPLQFKIELGLRARI